MATHESGERFGGRFDPTNVVRALFVPLSAFLASAGVLVALSPLRGTIRSVDFLPGLLALRTAGADPVVALAAVGMGLARLYLTGVPAVLLAAGGLCSLFGRDRPRTLAVGVACGVLAAGTLTALSGCHCSAGSTMALWRSATQGVSIGLGSVAVLGSTLSSIAVARGRDRLR